MRGVAQNAMTSPDIIGCRTQAYSHETRKAAGVNALLRYAVYAWRKPKSSKWSIMNVDATTIDQPAAYALSSTTVAAGTRSTSQRTALIGRHSQNTAMSVALAMRTNVLRSAAGGRNDVNHRLNADLAMTVCCAANRLSSARSTTIAATVDAGDPESTVLKVPAPATNTTAHAIAARKARYPTAA